jgi:restriction endonuclease Mrr
MNVWEIAILKCIESYSGKVMLQQIYERLSSFIKLTEDDLRETEWGGRPAYQHQVRSHIVNLCQAGELNRISRGCYSLTDKGRKRIN